MFLNRKIMTSTKNCSDKSDKIEELAENGYRSDRGRSGLVHFSRFYLHR